jgi:hypothetical protein
MAKVYPTVENTSWTAEHSNEGSLDGRGGCCDLAFDGCGGESGPGSNVGESFCDGEHVGRRGNVMASEAVCAKVEVAGSTEAGRGAGVRGP